MSFLGIATVLLAVRFVLLLARYCGDDLEIATPAFSITQAQRSRNSF